MVDCKFATEKYSVVVQCNEAGCDVNEQINPSLWAKPMRAPTNSWQSGLQAVIRAKLDTNQDVHPCRVHHWHGTEGIRTSSVFSAPSSTVTYNDCHRIYRLCGRKECQPLYGQKYIIASNPAVHHCVDFILKVLARSTPGALPAQPARVFLALYSQLSRRLKAAFRRFDLQAASPKFLYPFLLDDVNTKCRLGLQMLPKL